MQTQTIFGADVDYVVVIILAFIISIAFILMITGRSVGLIKSSRVKNKEDEKATDALLTSLKRYTTLKDFEILENITLAQGDSMYTFDAIILGYFGCFALKSCNKNGDIYADYGAKTWVQVFNKQRFEFEDPMKEMTGSVRFLKEIFKNEKVKVSSIDSSLVLTGKAVSPVINKKIPFYTTKSIVSALATEKFVADNGAEINAMKDALLKYKI